MDLYTGIALGVVILILGSSIASTFHIQDLAIEYIYKLREYFSYFSFQFVITASLFTIAIVLAFIASM